MPAVVAFISQKGGVGKSTLARALAAVAAHAGLKVFLADLDPQQQTLMQWQQARTNSKRVPKITVGAFGNVDDALTAGARHDLLIVDAPGSINRGTLKIVRCADLIVLPTGPSLDDLHPTVLSLHELVGADTPKFRIVATLCRVLSDDEERAARAYLHKAGYEVLPGSIPERAAYRAAQNQGQALTETAEKSLNKKADVLMEALLRKVATVGTDAVDASVGTRKKGDVA